MEARHVEVEVGEGDDVAATRKRLGESDMLAPWSALGESSFAAWRHFLPAHDHVLR